jgi:predicted nucleic acid-binding protein
LQTKSRGLRRTFLPIWRSITGTTGLPGYEAIEAMTEVFADAFFFIAFLNQNDQYHARVQAEISKDRKRIVTTAWVLVEVADALCVPTARAPTHRFIVGLLDNPAVYVASDSSWLERGLTLFGRRPDKNWSLTDCISFAVMEDRGLTHALTADRHFAQAGFVPVFA